VTIGFQVGALIQVRDGQDVGPGEVLARIPRRSEDPRHYRWSAACGRTVRSPYAEGQGHAGRDDRYRVLRQGNQGQDRLQITDLDGKVWEELMPKERNILVHEGQVVNKGE
jgi:DNA-directed RNA polymerase subunit beta'